MVLHRGCSVPVRVRTSDATAPTCKGRSWQSRAAGSPRPRGLARADVHRGSAGNRGSREAHGRCSPPRSRKSSKPRATRGRSSSAVTSSASIGTASSLASVTAVQWKPAGGMVNGFIQFTLAGGNEPRSRFGRPTTDAANDENKRRLHEEADAGLRGATHPRSRAPLCSGPGRRSRSRASPTHWSSWRSSPSSAAPASSTTRSSRPRSPRY